MRIINLWRKSRFSESYANSFANGRAKAIYAIAFMVLWAATSRYMAP